MVENKKKKEGLRLKCMSFRKPLSSSVLAILPFLPGEKLLKPDSSQLLNSKNSSQTLKSPSVGFSGSLCSFQGNFYDGGRHRDNGSDNLAVKQHDKGYFHKESAGTRAFKIGHEDTDKQKLLSLLFLEENIDLIPDDPGIQNLFAILLLLLSGEFGCKIFLSDHLLILRPYRTSYSARFCLLEDEINEKLLNNEQVAKKKHGCPDMLDEAKYCDTSMKASTWLRCQYMLGITTLLCKYENLAKCENLVNLFLGVLFVIIDTENMKDGSFKTYACESLEEIELFFPGLCVKALEKHLKRGSSFSRVFRMPSTFGNKNSCISTNWGKKGDFSGAYVTLLYQLLINYLILMSIDASKGKSIQSSTLSKSYRKLRKVVMKMNIIPRSYIGYFTERAFNGSCTEASGTISLFNTLLTGGKECSLLLGILGSLIINLPSYDHWKVLKMTHSFECVYRYKAISSGDMRNAFDFFSSTSQISQLHMFIKNSCLIENEFGKIQDFPGIRRLLSFASSPTVEGQLRLIILRVLQFIIKNNTKKQEMALLENFFLEAHLDDFAEIQEKKLSILINSRHDLETKKLCLRKLLEGILDLGNIQKNENKLADIFFKFLVEIFHFHHLPIWKEMKLDKFVTRNVWQRTSLAPHFFNFFHEISALQHKENEQIAFKNFVVKFLSKQKIPVRIKFFLPILLCFAQDPSINPNFIIGALRLLMQVRISTLPWRIGALILKICQNMILCHSDLRTKSTISVLLGEFLLCENYLDLREQASLYLKLLGGSSIYIIEKILGKSEDPVFSLKKKTNCPKNYRIAGTFQLIKLQKLRRNRRKMGLLDNCSAIFDLREESLDTKISTNLKEVSLTLEENYFKKLREATYHIVMPFTIKFSSEYSGKNELKIIENQEFRLFQNTSISQKKSDELQENCSYLYNANYGIDQKLEEAAQNSVRTCNLTKLYGLEIFIQHNKNYKPIDIIRVPYLEKKQQQLSVPKHMIKRGARYPIEEPPSKGSTGIASHRNCSLFPCSYEVAIELKAVNPIPAFFNVEAAFNDFEGDTYTTKLGGFDVKFEDLFLTVDLDQGLWSNLFEAIWNNPTVLKSLKIINNEKRRILNLLKTRLGPFIIKDTCGYSKNENYDFNKPATLRSNTDEVPNARKTDRIHRLSHRRQDVKNSRSSVLKNEKYSYIDLFSASSDDSEELSNNISSFHTVKKDIYHPNREVYMKNSAQQEKFYKSTFIDSISVTGRCETEGLLGKNSLLEEEMTDDHRRKMNDVQVTKFKEADQMNREVFLKEYLPQRQNHAHNQPELTIGPHTAGASSKLCEDEGAISDKMPQNRTEFFHVLIFIPPAYHILMYFAISDISTVVRIGTDRYQLLKYIDGFFSPWLKY